MKTNNVFHRARVNEIINRLIIGYRYRDFKLNTDQLNTHAFEK